MLMPRSSQLSIRWHAYPDHEVTALAGKVTRVVTIFVLLRRHLSENFPICLYEAEWIMTTLLADLENLAQKELKAMDDSAIS
jgi:hypothetical protein